MGFDVGSDCCDITELEGGDFGAAVEEEGWQWPPFCYVYLCWRLWLHLYNALDEVWMIW